MLCQWLLALALAASPARAEDADFAPQARTLAAVVACAPGATPPSRFDAKVLSAHCRQLAMMERWWQHRWLARAQPFLEKVVPADLPPRVVYPFGGGDLLTALVTFPHATEINTVSLEPSGDVRAVDTIDPEDLDGALADVRDMTTRLFAVAHSKTSTMSKMAKAKFPGELALALIALTMNDLEPVSVRYFRVSPDGDLHYLSPEEISAGSRPPVSSPHSAASASSATSTSTTLAAVTAPLVVPLPPTGRPQPFANLEIEFRPRGGGPTRVFRHISANLDDQHLNADPGVIRYLETKGNVTAMTKAASYLLWWRGFSQIRGYLLGHMVWMISDSTGIPPENASAAGFEQIPYGHFEGTFLKTTQKQSEAFQRLWSDSVESISFRFGYPDIAGNAHLMITRHPAK
jgi:hypothetical protein